MIGIWMMAGALLLVMIASELALRETKLQTGLGRVLVVWALLYLFAVYPLFHYGDIGPLSFTMFWAGAFLSWFGVRSHIESSILLRMLVLLRERPLSRTELLAKYTAHYGEQARIEELFRGGLAVREGARLSVTDKGKRILRIVELLR